MMPTPIPSYTQACLAADEVNNSFYLVGSPTLGVLDVNYVTDITASNVQEVATQYDPATWNTDARKACFRIPASRSANGPIKISQFGLTTTAFTLALPNGTVKPVDVIGSGNSFVSPKLFAWSAQMPDYNVFIVFSNIAKPNYTRWLGIRQTFIETDPGSLIRYDLGHFPSEDPLLALGTFTYSSDTVSSGVCPGEHEQYYTFKRRDTGNDVVHSLREVSNTGVSPPFSTSMAAAALSQRIITYTARDAQYAYFNSFDTVSGTWSGPNLVSGGSSKTRAIVGGVIAGLIAIAIAIAIIFFVRRRRRSHQTRHNLTINVSKPEAGTTSENIDGSNLGYVQVAQAYPLPPSFVPPPPPPSNNGKGLYSPHHAYRSLSAESDLTVLDPNHPYCPSYVSPPYVSPTSYRDSQMTEVSQVTPQSPEPSYIEARKSTSSLRAAQSPQYVPNRTSTTESAGRHPQSIMSALSDIPNSP
ncbi:hypothetical protein BGW39_005473 [Mortierella sp. 14UC]|nr:hypothetical protein BGW39_005473 [Mortierella sp. 14UC]